MKEVIKIILSIIVWGVGALAVFGLVVVTAVLDIFKDISEGVDNGKQRENKES